MALVETKEVSKIFGGLVALDRVSLEVREGEILGILGPNGAGKSTLYNVLSGVYKPEQGGVFLMGEDITGLRPDQIAQKGLVRTFQTNALFKGFTVLENLVAASHLYRRIGFFESLFNMPSNRSKAGAIRERAMEIVEWCGLLHVKDQLAKSLPHGQQRRLGVAIGLACHPKVLLMDEPLTGRSASEVADMLDFIRRIRQGGITLVMIEHRLRAVMEICERIIVLQFGKKITEGSPQEISQNREVIAAYLGGR